MFQCLLWGGPPYGGLQGPPHGHSEASRSGAAWPQARRFHCSGRGIATSRILHEVRSLFQQALCPSRGGLSSRGPQEREADSVSNSSGFASPLFEWGGGWVHPQSCRLGLARDCRFVHCDGKQLENKAHPDLGDARALRARQSTRAGVCCSTVIGPSSRHCPRRWAGIVPDRPVASVRRSFWWLCSNCFVIDA